MKRKLFILPLIIALLVTCMLQAFASDNNSSNGVAVTNGVGAPGKQVKLIVSAPSRMADSVGLILSYDEGLTLSEESKWLLSEDNALADVNVEKNIAAWAGNAVDIKGDIFELVFIIDENAQVGDEMNVSCQVGANLGTGVELSGTATATVTVQNLAKVSGTVTSYGSDASKAVTVELLDDVAQVVQTAVLESGENTYEFDVEQGTYTLRVSKSKHCTREYEIVMDNLEDQVLDVEICLYGDVDKNGEIDPLDALQILNVFNNEDSLLSNADEYVMSAADVDQSGEVDPLDALQILNVFNNEDSVFDTME